MRYSERKEGWRERRRTATDNSQNSSRLRFVLTLLLLLGDRFEFHDFFHLITAVVFFFFPYPFSSSFCFILYPFFLPLFLFSSILFTLFLPSYPWFIWIMNHLQKERTFWQLSYQTQSFTWHHSPSYCYILCSSYFLNSLSSFMESSESDSSSFLLLLSIHIFASFMILSPKNVSLSLIQFILPSQSHTYTSTFFATNAKRSVRLERRFR